MIVVIGFMGAGKTTVGRFLAERLGVPFVDSDLVIEHEQQRSIREIFAEHGEPGFRDVEEATIAALLEGPACVLSLGGGACGRAATRERLATHTVIYLHVEYDEAIVRVGRDEYRPMLHNPGLPGLYAGRLQLYADTATLTSYTTGRRVEDIALEIIDRIVGRPELDGTRGILVAPPGGSYRVHVGLGIAAQASRLAPALADAERVVVLAGANDPTAAIVADCFGERGLPVHQLSVPAGADAKTFATVGELAGELTKLNCHRGDLLVGVGGEAVCDITGFLAATFHRGMPHALVPTTLEAQADSSVGGKCGVDLGEQQNALGVIHQPVVVVCDVAIAAANAADFDAGMAEIVKHGLVADPALLETLRTDRAAVLGRDPARLVELVRRSVEIKADIVTADEREEGGRRNLNYGHTFSRAFDHVPAAAASGNTLALGLMAAAHLSRRLGRLDDAGVAAHRDTLAALDLPTSVRVRLDDLDAAFARDKKYRRGWRFVVLDRLGRAEAGVSPTPEDVAAALADLALDAPD
ncbi:MAG: bifunctional shikimate kinase/3-dehydroquinate synthase [Tetrasphaera sp.]